MVHLVGLSGVQVVLQHAERNAMHAEGGLCISQQAARRAGNAAKAAERSTQCRRAVCAAAAHQWGSVHLPHDPPVMLVYPVSQFSHLLGP